MVKNIFELGDIVYEKIDLNNIFVVHSISTNLAGWPLVKLKSIDQNKIECLKMYGLMRKTTKATEVKIKMYNFLKTKDEA